MPCRLRRRWRPPPAGLRAWQAPRRAPGRPWRRRGRQRAGAHGLRSDAHHSSMPQHLHMHMHTVPCSPSDRGCMLRGRATVSSRQKNVASSDCDIKSCTKSQPKATESSREQPRANESTPRSPGSLRSPMRIISCTFPLSHYHVIPDDNPFSVVMHAG